MSNHGSPSNPSPQPLHPRKSETEPNPTAPSTLGRYKVKSVQNRATTTTSCPQRSHHPNFPLPLELAAKETKQIRYIQHGISGKNYELEQLLTDDPSRRSLGLHREPLRFLQLQLKVLRACASILGVFSKNKKFLGWEKRRRRRCSSGGDMLDGQQGKEYSKPREGEGREVVLPQREGRGRESKGETRQGHQSWTGPVPMDS
jgi:hypothetical protein